MEEWHAPGLSIAVVQGDQIDAKVNIVHISSTNIVADYFPGLRLRQIS